MFGGTVACLHVCMSISNCLMKWSRWRTLKLATPPWSMNYSLAVCLEDRNTSSKPFCCFGKWQDREWLDLQKALGPLGLFKTKVFILWVPSMLEKNICWRDNKSFASQVVRMQSACSFNHHFIRQMQPSQWGTCTLRHLSLWTSAATYSWPWSHREPTRISNPESSARAAVLKLASTFRDLWSHF